MAYISDLIPNSTGKIIIFFGTGSASKKLCECLSLEISYFVDNDRKRHGTYFTGKPIKAPDELLNEDKDRLVLIIASQYYEEISEQLIKLGFVENVHFWNGLDFLEYTRHSGQLDIIPRFKEIRIENTNICNYRCVFCPREKMTRPKGIMSADDFEFVIKKIKEEVPDFSGDIHLHGYGEPTLDPKLAEKVRLTKKYYPHAVPLILSSLGVRQDKTYFEELVDNGLQVILVSMYAVQEDFYQKFHGSNSLEAVICNLRNLINIWREHPTFRIQLQGIPMNLYEQFSVTENEVKKYYSEFLKKISFPFDHDISKAILHNYGNGRTFNEPEKNRCSIVSGIRREILQVTWNLKVKPCTFDYNADVVWGDLKNDSLRAVFTGSVYQAFIEAHHQHLEDKYSCCRNCDRKTNI